MGFRRVLVAVDSSPIAAHAARVGLDLGRSLGADVAFIHVVDRAAGFAPDSGIPAGEFLAMAEQDGKRLVAEFVEAAAVQPPPLAFVPIGKTGDEIIRTARDWPADVIVIGSHGHGGLTRLLVGSVAETVMRHAPCPVLVVRAPS